MKKHSTSINFKYLIALNIFLYSLLSVESYSQTWVAMSGGLAARVNCLTIYQPLQSSVIAGGDFSGRIRMWVPLMGGGWTWGQAQLYGGFSDGSVYSLAVYNEKLIAAGSFTSSTSGNPLNRIASMDLINPWTPLGLGTNGNIYALTIYNNQLIAAGGFTSAGGVAANRIARWDGTSWSPLGSGVNDTVYSLTVFGNDLIIGGKFTMAGTLSANRIVRWNGSTYSALGIGIDNGAVLTMSEYNSTLFVGGSFTTIGGIPVNYIARWSGSNWGTAGTGMNGAVNTLYIFNSELYTGGAFTIASDSTANSIARWDGSRWIRLGSGVSGGTNPSVNAMAKWQGLLVAAGEFTSPGTRAANWGLTTVAPTLLSPLDGATNVPTPTTLDWEDVPYADNYLLEISLSPSFQSTVITTRTYTSEYTVALSENTTYFWRVNATNGRGTSPWSLIWYFTTAIIIGTINDNEIPKEFGLYQNYPNPFNPVTKIKFNLPVNSSSDRVILSLYDVTGKLVKVLYNQNYKAGAYEIVVNLNSYPSGVYFYSLNAGDYKSTRKMILTK